MCCSPQERFVGSSKGFQQSHFREIAVHQPSLPSDKVKREEETAFVMFKLTAETFLEYRFREKP
jgi:hypothetical protein